MTTLPQLRATHELAIQQAVKDAITETSGNVSAAARLLDTSHVYLCKLMRRYDLNTLAGMLRVKAGWGRVMEEGPKKGQVVGNPKRAKGDRPSVAKDVVK